MKRRACPGGATDSGDTSIVETQDVVEPVVTTDAAAAAGDEALERV